MALNADSRQGPALLVVCGPTASGKTALAVELADRYAGEIVSADSRQVYRLMNIGTAKPTAAEQGRARHHLIDVADPDEEFHAARYAELAAAAIADIVARQRRPLLVGGTGLYIKALTEGLLEAPGADPDLRRRLHARAAEQGSAALHQELAGVDPLSAAKLHPNDLVRIVRALEVFAKSGRPLSELQREHAFAARPYRTLKLGIDPGREELYRRIDRRAEEMFAAGLIDEAEALLTAGYDSSCKALRTIGYRQAFAVLRGEIGRDEALDDLKRVTRRYARQQQTWFCRDKSIIWLESSADFVTIQAFIDDFYAI